MEPKNTRVCPICSNPVIGRSDKLYCSDICRYEGNNQKRLDDAQQMAEVYRKLIRNRRILKLLSPNGKAIVDRSILISMGYDTALFTSLYITKKGRWYYICGDYAMSPFTENHSQKSLIVKVIEEIVRWDPWNGQHYSVR